MPESYEPRPGRDVRGRASIEVHVVQVAGAALLIESVGRGTGMRDENGEAKSRARHVSVKSGCEH